MSRVRIAEPAAIEDAARLLTLGRLVAFPTETVYGLGGDALSTSACQAIFQAKNRPADHPLIVHLPDAAQLDRWAVNIPEAAWKLAKAFWPGPLTLIVPKHPDVPNTVTGGQNAIGLRVPNHPVALALLSAFGSGIAAPSANRFQHVSPTRASHVLDDLGERVELILDGGPCSVGLESTIVNLTGAQPQILRPGAIGKEALQAVIGRPIVDHAVCAGQELRVSGAMAIHYAPQTPCFLCATSRLGKVLLDYGQAGLLTYSASLPNHPVRHHIRLSGQPMAYGHELYQALRTLDKANVEAIIIESPPEIKSWHAVNDRLRKAAKPYSK
ncbi:MAG: L-threonylcarbamoyladenylate synthase [Methylococcales bacterium]|nr:L-threonylcarbamoyladenylate synthase [Methylococcales bacterium]